MRQQFAAIGFGLFFVAATLSSATAQDPANDRLTLLGESAPGRVKVEKVGTVYSLKYRGSTDGYEYQIDVGHIDVQRGMIRLWERYSDCYPMVAGGPTFRGSTGAGYLPVNLAPHATLTNHYINGKSVILEYTDNVPGSGVHHRRHTLTLTGKVLSVTVEDLDQSLVYNGNYSGMYMGPTSGTEDVRTIPMQGALSTPLFMFQNGADHYFFGGILDIFQSNASDFLLPDVATLAQGGNSINFTMHTSSRHYPTTTGQLSAPLKDTWNFAISSSLADVLMTPTQTASPYRELLEHRTIVLLAEGTTPWSNYQSHLSQFAAWGMDDIAAYCFHYWSSSADDPPAPQNQGPDWSPAKDPGNFTALGTAARNLGMPLGVYTSFAAMPNTAPSWVYNPGDISRTNTGAYKVSTQNGTPLIAISASGIHARREAQSIKQNYGLSAAYLDIQSYASPSHGADGDHIDQLMVSPWAKTIGQGVLDQKRWMRDMTDILEGPMLGEGSIATFASNREWLWGGYCDSVQRVINSGNYKKAFQQPLNDPHSPTLWPVIPEFELRVMAPLQANHGNGFYDRFFSRSDTGMTNASTGLPNYPLSRAALDRYRIYEITYGHTSFFMTSGAFGVVGNMLGYGDMLREYYLGRALQARYLDSPVRTIQYLHNGLLSSFEKVFFQTESVDTFRHPKLRIAYKNGLEIYLNHGPSSWNVTAGGVAYTLPEDGWVASQPSSGFVAFSAIPPGTGDQRIDYCFAPGEHEFFDGRGNVSGYGSINTGTAKRIKLSNFIRGITVQEPTANSIQVINGVTPVIASIEIVGDPSIVIGDRVPLKAIAHFTNGAFRNVTTLVNWSSTNPGVSTINEGGALIGFAIGQTTITTSSFQGFAPPPFVVTVQ